LSAAELLGKRVFALWESHNEGWITTVIALASPWAISAAAAAASLLDFARNKKKCS